MRLAYRLTSHAQERMRQRGISADQALAALHKRGHIQIDGIVEHYDPASRVVVKADPASGYVITIYRRLPQQGRRLKQRNRPLEAGQDVQHE